MSVGTTFTYDAYGLVTELLPASNGTAPSGNSTYTVDEVRNRVTAFKASSALDHHNRTSDETPNLGVAVRR